MATNNNNNGHNASIQGPGQMPNRGFNAALEQSSIRKEYADRMFNDGGYLDSSIKDLNRQSAELKRLMKQSKDLTAAEEKRYKNAINQMKKLAKEQEEIRNSQETSSKELQKSLNESAKLRGKAVDELYKKYMQGEEALNDMTSDQIEARIKYFANISREIKATAEEINDATKEFDKANKDWKDGAKESLKDITNAAKDLTNMFNLHSLAQNQWTEKENERLEVISKINSGLGHQLGDGKNAYNRLYDSFTDFNDNVNNLFSSQDFSQYIQTAVQSGVHNEDLLKRNMEASLMATKYLGMTNETQSSMYKYMKITNNNDTINKYNKTMIALQKEGISVNRDMLNTMIQEDLEVSDVLMAAGLSGETLEQFNSDRTILNAQIQDKYGESTAQQIDSMVNGVIKGLGTDSGRQAMVQMGINPFDIESVLQSGDVNKLYDTVISGVEKMADSWDGNLLGNMTFFDQLGLNVGDINAARQIGSGSVNNMGEVTDKVKEIAKNMTDQETKDYVNKNAAISDNERTANWLETHSKKFFDSWDGYAKLAKAAFAVTIGGQIIQSISSLGSIFSKLLGKNSIISKGADASAKFAGGSGTAGKALSILGTGAAVIGLTAATISALGSYFSGKWSESYDNQYSENLEALKGTSNEGNNAVATADTIVSASKSQTWFGEDMTNTYHGLGYGLSKLTTKDKNSLNKSLTQWMSKSGTFKNRDAVMTWAMLMDMVGSLDSINELGFNFSRDDIAKYIYDKSEDGTIDEFWSTMNSVFKAGWKPYKDNNKGRINNYDEFKSEWENSPYNSDTGIYDKFEKSDGYHKAGLNRVPKDNYRALLHKDEMVLNQEEAESYRLQKEYEKNNFAGKPEMKGFGIGGSVGNYSYGNYPSYAGHTGIDFNTPIGTPIGSATSGTVVESLDKKGNQANGYASFGRWVVVKSDDNGLYYLYAHLKERLANKGQHVNAGELIGYSGNNGNVRPLPTASNPSAGQHLHFQVGTSPRGGHVNPERYATEAMFNVNGSSSSSSSESTDNSNSSGQKVSALAKSIHSERRLLPGIGGDGDIPDGVNPVDRIVTSVDGVSTKIIKYLDEIRAEQEDQRRLINAFSASQQTIQ